MGGSIERSWRTAGVAVVVVAILVGIPLFITAWQWHRPITPLHLALATGWLIWLLLTALLVRDRLRVLADRPRAPGAAIVNLPPVRERGANRRLDVALRDLGHHLSSCSPRPDIIGVRLEGDAVHVVLTAPTGDPPPGWLETDSHWILPAHVEPTHTVNPGAGLPTLVSVGGRPGRHLLINVDRLGTLRIGGDPERAQDLLRHIACELARSDWSARTTVVLCGFGAEADLIHEMAPDRVPALTSGSTILTLRERTQHGSTVLVLANPDPRLMTVLSEALPGIPVITTALGGHCAEAAGLTVSDNGRLTVNLPGMGHSTDAAALTSASLEGIVHNLRSTRIASPASRATRLAA